MRVWKITPGILMFLPMLTGNLLAEQVQVSFVGAKAPAVVYGSVYVSPYVANVNNQPLTVVCDDFYGSIQSGSAWTADVFPASNPTGALFAGVDSNVYNWLVYLSIQVLNAYAAHDDYGQAVASYAMWQITDHPFDPNTPYNYGSAAQSFRNDVDAMVAVAKGTTVDTSGWVILTPTDEFLDEPSQEFLTQVPEPSALLLFGVGLAALVGPLRRRFCQ